MGGDSIGHCEIEVHMNMCLIGNGYRDTAVRTSRPNYFTFLFVGLGKVYKRKVITRDELLARTSDVAAA